MAKKYRISGYAIRLFFFKLETPEKFKLFAACAQDRSMELTYFIKKKILRKGIIKIYSIIIIVCKLPKHTLKKTDLSKNTLCGNRRYQD